MRAGHLPCKFFNAAGGKATTQVSITGRVGDARHELIGHTPSQMHRPRWPRPPENDAGPLRHRAQGFAVDLLNRLLGAIAAATGRRQPIFPAFQVLDTLGCGALR